MGGLGSPITGEEVAWAVKQLQSSSALGVDEIVPELLKALDVVGLAVTLERLYLSVGPDPDKQQKMKRNEWIVFIRYVDLGSDNAG